MIEGSGSADHNTVEEGMEPCAVLGDCRLSGRKDEIVGSLRSPYNARCDRCETELHPRLHANNAPRINP